MKINNQAEYDAAKLRLRDNGSLHAKRIKHALLQYRRQNKIYKVGDLVVSTLRGSGDNLFQFENWLVDFMDCIRHATDTEIEVGRRLDLPESVVKSLGEVS